MKALDLIDRYGGIDGGHHKQWVLDQVVRALTGCPVETATALTGDGRCYDYEKQGESEEYRAWVSGHRDGEDGPETYDWDVGIPP